MSEPSFQDGEVVWVKWSSCWWPGEVWSKTRVPNDLTSSLRKPVIAFVKFFQEDSFECVKSPNNIMKYDCDKKLEYIKKGMDKHRSNVKVMSNFPADVVKAEKLTNGDANILSNLDTPTKQKSAAASPTKPATPVTVTKKAPGTYNSSTKVQVLASPAPKSDKKFTCTLCDFATDRMNLLMFHIKNHSSKISPRTSDVSSPVVPKKSTTTKTPTKRSLEASDSIADDVRKIKESLKKAAKPSPVAKKAREPAAKVTPNSRSRAAKKAEPVEVKEVEKVEEKSKPVNELKNELLADWMDDDDIDMDKKQPEELSVSLPSPPKLTPTQEKVGESSKTIRNIPKKQRTSEIAVADTSRASEGNVEATTSPAKEEPPKKSEEPQEAVSPEVPKKFQRANKKKLAINSVESEPEAKKVAQDTDELLMATNELLNETEVPKVENAQVPSTFHKSNDIDKRNLPPKERNKRIFRANKSRESPPKAVERPVTSENNGSPAKSEVAVNNSAIQNELMLPHKKKQSSRLATTEKPSPVRETRNVRETWQESPTVEPRTRKKRKSNETSKIDEDEPVKAETTIDGVQSPLREAVAVSPVPNSNSTQRRGQKRRNSKDSHQLALSLEDSHSEPKKLHKSNSETQSKIIVACASETICITSKGQLSVASKDTLVTTEANTVMVTSQVIITEAMRQPIVSSPPMQSPKLQISTSIKLPSHALKDAIKFPPEELMEMKKQGLVTVGSDLKQKFTEKGRQIYKQMMEKTSEVANSKKEETASEQDPTPELAATADVARSEASKDVSAVIHDAIDKVEGSDESVAEQDAVKESNGTPAQEDKLIKSTNNNDNEPEVTAPPPKELKEEAALENGRDGENESEAQTDDSNNGNLIALQAENFGGPPNCFYLCRQIDDRYEPVDNQILVLNAQNALVPYEGEAVEDSLAPTTATDSMTGYPQLSPNSNIIINTPNGQKIELDHFAIQALQEQADENGIASIELLGEQLELNINGILEAISAQQEASEGESLIQGAALIDGDSALILDTSTELAVETNPSATQVSEVLTKPIMSTTLAPEITSTKVTIADSVSKNLNIEDSLASIGVTTQNSRSNVPKCLELPITITNPVIAETVNHRKLAHAPVLGDLAEVIAESESFVVQTLGNDTQA